MLNKVVLIVFDGLGDRPIEQFGWKTPLEAASTPNMDRLSSEAQCGMMWALGRGKRPGSDTSHLAILGYDPDEYYPGRGPIEVAGVGCRLQQGDVALRGNLGTVGDDGMIRDRRAGRIRDVSPLTEAVDGMKIDGVEFVVQPGTGHRAGVVMHGEGLSDQITDADPHEPDLPVKKVAAKTGTPAAEHTAEVLNEFLARSHEILRDHPLNKQRESEGQLPANFILVRGAGQYEQIPAFEDRYGMRAACIAGGGLYKGIGSLLGMDVLDVPGATGMPDTDVNAKFTAAKDALDEYDFVFVHVKAADNLAEDGNFEGKRDFLERVDQAAEVLLALPPDSLLVMTADHSTPCTLMQHSADPVPVLFRGTGVRVDSTDAFGERACAEGGLGFLVGLDIMPQVMNLMGRLPLIGA